MVSLGLVDWLAGLAGAGSACGLCRAGWPACLQAWHVALALPPGADADLLRCPLPRPAAEPLLLDVATTLQRKRRHVDCVVGGRYGLASKDFTPAM